MLHPDTICTLQDISSDLINLQRLKTLRTAKATRDLQRQRDLAMGKLHEAEQELGTAGSLFNAERSKWRSECEDLERKHKAMQVHVQQGEELTQHWKRQAQFWEEQFHSSAKKLQATTAEIATAARAMTKQQQEEAAEEQAAQRLLREFEIAAAARREQHQQQQQQNQQLDRRRRQQQQQSQQQTAEQVSSTRFRPRFSPEFLEQEENEAAAAAAMTRTTTAPAATGVANHQLLTPPPALAERARNQQQQPGQQSAQKNAELRASAVRAIVEQLLRVL